MGEIETKELVQFNLGVDWNMKISKRIDNSIAAYLLGDLENWFFNLKGIKLLIVSYLSKDERKELTDLEADISSNIRYQDPNIRKKAGAAIEKYDIKIKCFLSEKGFLNPIKDDLTNIYGQEG